MGLGASASTLAVLGPGPGMAPIMKQFSFPQLVLGVWL
jgi:hypothetical protein